jgi:uncharacterized lipoprotein YmbA
MKQLQVFVLFTLSGCAATQQREQYFMVVEPSADPPSAAIYKVTASLKGIGLVQYKLNEGYVQRTKGENARV